MLSKITVLVIASLAIACLATPSRATPISYEIHWCDEPGSCPTNDGYSMTGHFSYDDSQVTDKTDIEGKDLTSFEMDVSQQGQGLLGTWACGTQSMKVNPLCPSVDGFNFHFDAQNDMFLIGGAFGFTNDPPLQLWNMKNIAGDCLSTGVGFASGKNGGENGNLVEGVCVNGTFVGSISGSDLAAEQIPVTVPEPTTLALLGAALTGVGFSRRNRAR